MMQIKEKIASILAKTKDKMHGFSRKIKEFIGENDVELTMITGLFFISFATYKVNFIAFLYLIGLIFVAFSMYLLKFPSRGGDK